MGKEYEFTQEKLIVGVIFHHQINSDEIVKVLEEKWGPCDYISDYFPFNFTDYYAREMGERLVRRFFSFEKLHDPTNLYLIKKESNKMEMGWSKNENRLVNLDPGLMALSRFVLASTKENAHRIPLRDGIYAELTLRFKNNDFEHFDWTYPDFKSRQQKDVLIKIRQIYKKQLKSCFQN